VLDLLQLFVLVLSLKYVYVTQMVVVKKGEQF
jgi:hypothetical protein